jgi:tRNA nucleotidyltransferase (CCA-adding enzyme)
MEYKIPKEVQTIFDKFQKAGFEIYLIGAAVRNLLTNKAAVDCDFTTNAKPKEILKLFPQGFYNNIYGTVGIPIVKKDGQKETYEITTYRSEKGYSDRRHPDKVTWGKTLEEDLKRRELTISAIALGPDPKTGALHLVDLFGGQQDLKNKIVRCVGDPNKRFAEDALRLLRAIRIATQLGFIIEKSTFSAIQKNAHLIKEVSAERIREELFKILKSDHPADGFQLLFNSGLLEHILPELTRGYGMAQAKHHKFDVFKHSIESLRHCPSPNPIVRLATLFHDVGKPITARGVGEDRTFYNHEVVGTSIVRNIAHRLHFSKKDREKLITLVRWHQFTVDENITDKAVRRFIRRVGQENIKDMIDLRIGDRLGGGCREATSWRLRRFMKRLIEVQKQPFSVTDLKVNGHDVMKILGIGPGPKVGKVLQALFEEVEEDGTKNKRSYLLKRIKGMARAEEKDPTP